MGKRHAARRGGPCPVACIRVAGGRGGAVPRAAGRAEPRPGEGPLLDRRLREAEGGRGGLGSPRPHTVVAGTWLRRSDPLRQRDSAARAPASPRRESGTYWPEPGGTRSTILSRTHKGRGHWVPACALDPRLTCVIPDKRRPTITLLPLDGGGMRSVGAGKRRGVEPCQRVHDREQESPAPYAKLGGGEANSATAPHPASRRSATLPAQGEGGCAWRRLARQISCEKISKVSALGSKRTKFAGESSARFRHNPVHGRSSRD